MCKFKGTVNKNQTFLIFFLDNLLKLNMKRTTKAKTVAKYQIPPFLKILPLTCRNIHGNCTKSYRERAKSL
jgi:hypothetical protein